MIFYYMLLVLSAFYFYPHLPEVFGLTLVKVVGILAVAAALARIVAAPHPLFLFRWAESRLFVLLFLIICGSSVVTYFAHGMVPSLLWSYVSHGAFLVATLAFLDSLKRVETACYVLLFSILLAALSAFKDYFRWGIGRPGGITGDPNYYALVVLCVLPMCFLLYFENTFSKKVFLVITGTLALASLLLASSRGGLIGLLVSLGYVLLRIRRRAAFFFAASIMLLLMLVTLPKSGFYRFQNEDYGAAVSVHARLELMKAGWQMVKSHPLLGVGAGMFKPLSDQYNPDVLGPQIAHNTYLELAAETGTFSLVIFLGILYCSWRRSCRMAAEFSQERDLLGERLCRSIEIGIVGFALTAAFLSAAYIRHLWIIVFFGVAIQRLRYLKTEPSTAPVSHLRQPRIPTLQAKRAEARR